MALGSVTQPSPAAAWLRPGFVRALRAVGGVGAALRAGGEGDLLGPSGGGSVGAVGEAADERAELVVGEWSLAVVVAGPGVGEVAAFVGVGDEIGDLVDGGGFDGVGELEGVGDRRSAGGLEVGG